MWRAMVESFGVWTFGDGKNGEMGNGSERAADQKKREGWNEGAKRKTVRESFGQEKTAGMASRFLIFIAGRAIFSS